jgi:hypothetical protein
LSRKAALVKSATRDWFTGFFTAHHDGFDGETKTRGGLGADDCAIIGRYSRAINQLSFAGEISLRGRNKS